MLDQARAPAELSAYWVKFALDFLDRVPEPDRAVAAIESLAAHLGPDGSLPVPGGTDDERLTPLTLSERPGGRSRALFSEAQIVEGRGGVTLRALSQLLAHGRLVQ